MHFHVGWCCKPRLGPYVNFKILKNKNKNKFHGALSGRFGKIEHESVIGQC
jgi:hypothetical protein